MPLLLKPSEKNWSGTIKRICICIEKMLFSIHKICIEIEDYITTVWNPEQNVESINTIYQNSVQSSTYQKWMSNTVKALRRRMAPPCCVFLFLWVTLRRASSCLPLLHREWVLQRMLWEAAAGSGTIDPFLF